MPPPQFSEGRASRSRTQSRRAGLRLFEMPGSAITWPVPSFGARPGRYSSEDDTSHRAGASTAISTAPPCAAKVANQQFRVPRSPKLREAHLREGVTAEQRPVLPPAALERRDDPPQD